jgi:hypothetical protein
MRTEADGLERYRLPPWRLRAVDLLPMADTRPVGKVDVPPPRDYSEAALWEHTMRVRAAEKEPPEVTRFPIGTWCAVGPDHSLYELREYRLDDPAVIFPEGQGPTLLSTKYASWIADGSDPPPGLANELQDGRVSVTEGHHRAMALRQAGRRTVQFWVSPVVGRPNQFVPSLTTWVGLTHRQAVHMAIEGGQEVPAEVLADYPDLRGMHRAADQPLRRERGEPPASAADFVARCREERAQRVAGLGESPIPQQPIGGRQMGGRRP